MFPLIITILIFLIIFFAQLLVLRILKKLNLSPFLSFLTHGFGMLIIIFYIVPHSTLPYTEILVYILLTILQVTFSFVPLLKQHSPTSVILLVLNERPQTETQILKRFDENQMILKRIEDLVLFGFISKQGSRYVVSSFGLFIAHCIDLFSSFIGVNLDGK